MQLFYNDGLPNVDREELTAMRLPPHRIYLLALRGRKTLHGRLLPSPDEAARMLRRLTGKDFGLDAERWAVWIKANRRGVHRSPSGQEEQARDE